MPNVSSSQDALNTIVDLLSPGLPGHMTIDRYDFRKTHAPRSLKPSLTDPSQHMSAKDIMSMYVRNIAVPRNEVINTDLDLSEFDGMDKLQKHTAYVQLHQRVQLLRKDLRDMEAKHRADKEQKDFDARVSKAAADIVAKQVKPDA